MNRREEAESALWNALPAQLLHEMQVWIIEAMLWIDQPLSASELFRTLQGGRLTRPDMALTLSGTSYHLRRLSDLKVIGFVRSRQVRGASQKFYRLHMPERVN